MKKANKSYRAAGVVSPTEVSADGTLRTPRVVGARDAGLLLLACRDVESGWQLHAVPAASATSRLDRGGPTVSWISASPISKPVSRNT